MGTIVSNAKRNNCKKLHCQKQPQGLFFEKLVHRIQLKIHRGMPNIECLSTELQDPKNNFPKRKQTLRSC